VLASAAPRCKNFRMKSLAFCAFFFLPAVAAFAQTPQPSSAPGEIISLERKIDELNTKIDALSQQILKLEPANGTSHIVARGETLTSIAKQYKVGVEELQKFNHIEDGRKLQAGQTVMIPSVSASPAASVSPSSTPQ